jgi:1-aminocyclopropane-1-carboxylate deaminase/D-cysteine desulfhydrase-like pyridoxal-dependent ACC family enzyme
MTTPHPVHERLRQLPRADLGVVPSPVEQWELDGRRIWVKRDDLNAPVLGGNKVRALEYLLAGVRDRQTVITVGGIGSTHILATAVHARRVGLTVRARRWPHELNAVGRQVARAIHDLGLDAPVTASPVAAFAQAWWRRVRHNEFWIPFGGTSALGMLGHVTAGLELGRQVADRLLPEPQLVVVPLGTGGTAAGLAVGLQLAGIAAGVIAVRCGPRTGVEGPYLAWLVRSVDRRLRQLGIAVPGPLPIVAVDHSVFAGAYARPHPRAEVLSAEVRERLGAGLDATYSAKACYAAWSRAKREAGPVLFWHTFDARWMTAVT